MLHCNGRAMPDLKFVCLSGIHFWLMFFITLVVYGCKPTVTSANLCPFTLLCSQFYRLKNSLCSSTPSTRRWTCTRLFKLHRDGSGHIAGMENGPPQEQAHQIMMMQHAPSTVMKSRCWVFLMMRLNAHGLMKKIFWVRWAWWRSVLESGNCTAIIIKAACTERGNVRAAGWPICYSSPDLAGSRVLQSMKPLLDELADWSSRCFFWCRWRDHHSCMRQTNTMPSWIEFFY